MLLYSLHVAPNPIDVNSIEIGKLIHSNNFRITWMVCTHIYELCVATVSHVALYVIIIATRN